MKVKYIASDNLEFDDKEQCELYEELLKYQESAKPLVKIYTFENTDFFVIKTITEFYSYLLHFQEPTQINKLAIVGLFKTSKEKLPLINYFNNVDKSAGNLTTLINKIDEELLTMNDKVRKLEETINTYKSIKKEILEEPTVLDEKVELNESKSKDE